MSLNGGKSSGRTVSSNVGQGNGTETSGYGIANGSNSGGGKAVKGIIALK